MEAMQLAGVNCDAGQAKAGDFEQDSPQRGLGHNKGNKHRQPREQSSAEGGATRRVTKASARWAWGAHEH
jgi:hypothetical protein